MDGGGGPSSPRSHRFIYLGHDCPFNYRAKSIKGEATGYERTRDHSPTVCATHPLHSLARKDGSKLVPVLHYADLMMGDKYPHVPHKPLSTAHHSERFCRHLPVPLTVCLQIGMTARRSHMLIPALHRIHIHRDHGSAFKHSLATVDADRWRGFLFGAWLGVVWSRSTNCSGRMRMVTIWLCFQGSKTLKTVRRC